MWLSTTSRQFTSFVSAPKEALFTQGGQWSVPLLKAQSKSIPEPAIDAIRQFVSIFLPEFVDRAFYSTKLCWYTDMASNAKEGLKVMGFCVGNDSMSVRSSMSGNGKHEVIEILFLYIYIMS